ncbi:MAG TPA: PAS domain S-box protein [Polyangiaceae bacterium LLY-WYZ-15_(1-7)]|nr:PAS domain S-box protein [Polyangiaceae bacterium LLY-WYZ-15_(1-7)]
MELIVAVNLLQALLVVGVLVFLRRQLRSRALDHWSIAWLAVCGRYGVLFIEQVRGPSTLLGTLEVLGALVQAWFFLLGAAPLAGRALPRPLIAVPIAVASWAVVAPALALPPLASDLPVYLGLSLALVAAGVTLFRHGPEAIGARTVSVALVLFGIHVADRPFLADVPAVAPYGYALAVLLQSAVGLGMLAVAFELSVQKVARAERRYRRIFENVPEGIFRTTPEGRFAAANPALVEMLGYGSFEELSAVSIPDAIYLDPDERAAMQAEYEEQGELAGYETTWRRRDGELIRVMLSGRVMRDEAGGSSATRGSCATSPRAGACRRRSGGRSAWRPWGGWRAGSRTTSTTS